MLLLTTAAKRRLRILLLTILFLGIPYVSLYANDSFQDLKSESTILFCGDEYISFAELTANEDQLEFKALEPIGDIGFTNEYYWVKVPVSNKSASKKVFYLETARPIIDSVSLYLLRNDGTIEKQYNGDAISFSEKSVQHRKTLFEFELNAEETALAYLHVKSDGESLQMPVNLMSANVLLESTYKEQIFYGLFYGVLLLAAILYLFFSFSVKDRTFLYYGFYVIFIGLMQFSIDGLFHQYITPDASYFNDRAVLTMAFIAALFLAKYGESFLNLKGNAPRLYRFFQYYYAAVILSLSMLLVVPGFLQFGYPVANLLGLVELVTLISAVIFLSTKKIKVDPFFIGGITFLVLGFVVFILNNFNSIPSNFITANGPKFGTGLEVIFLSISMANRIKLLRLEKEEIQKIALQREIDSNEMKSSFLSNISHELRTPLNLIMGVSNNLKDSQESPEIRKKMNLILGSSNDLLRLINDILNFTEIEKGKQNIQKEEFDLETMMEGLCKNYQSRALSKKLEFRSLIDKDLPKKILGDEAKLEEIISNLLDNAVKFTDKGEVEFRIDCIRKKNMVELQIRISDTGIGISENKMRTMYESFTKRSFNDKREFGGLGLGLFMAKTFVEAQGGELNIENRPKGGVCATVLLNYEIVLNTNADTGASQEPFNFDGLRILYVEDNEMNQMVLKMLASTWGNVDLQIANHGIEALQILKDNSVDVIFMDLQMPEMDGFETTREIRNGRAGLDHKHVPIIALTADITEETKERILGQGANDLLTKPVDGPLLKSRVAQILQEMLVRV